MSVDTRQIETTLDEMVAHARGLVPTLQERRNETEALRRLPLETVHDIQRNGILRAMLPPELNGLDLGAGAVFDIVKELARGCAATAWVAGNWSVHGALVAMFPTAGIDEVFADAKDGITPPVATAFSPARAKTRLVEGGAWVSGQWDFVSGVNHSEWVVVQALSDSGLVAHLVRVSDVTVHDNWETSGLRGTGSHDISIAAEGLFVPAHRLVNMATSSDGNSAGAERYGTVSLRLPLTNVFGAGLAGTIVGCALAAVDFFREHIGKNVGGISGVKMAARAEVQLYLGKASADVDAAVTVVRATYADMDDSVRTGRGFTLQDRARWRRDIGWGAEAATAALTRLYSIAGSYALRRGHPLDCAFRDGIAASHHFALGWDRLNLEYGKMLLGEE